MPACRKIEVSRRQYSPPTMPPIGCEIVPPEYGHEGARVDQRLAGGPLEQGAGSSRDDQLPHVADHHRGQEELRDRHRLHVRHRDLPAGSATVLAARLRHALRALMADGGRDHAVGADGPATAGAMHAGLDVGMPIAVLPGGGRGHRGRLIHGPIVRGGWPNDAQASIGGSASRAASTSAGSKATPIDRG